MPAMTNPSDYGWYGLTPPELPGDTPMFFNHEIPQEEKDMHIADRCCECIPFIDPESDYHAYIHNRMAFKPSLDAQE